MSLYAIEGRNVTYNELLREVDLLEMTSDFQMDTIIRAREINYSTNFTSEGIGQNCRLL